MKPEEEQLLQDMIDEVHGQFKDHIKAARPQLTDEILNQYADGRVFTGSQAVKLGFADAIGSQSDVMEILKEELGVEGELKVVDANKRGSRLERLLEESYTGSDMGASLLSAFTKISPKFSPELQAGRAYLLPYFWFDQPSAGPATR